METVVGPSLEFHCLFEFETLESVYPDDVITLLRPAICSRRGPTAFLASALLSRAALVKVKTTNNATHFNGDALQSSPTAYEHALRCVFKTPWVEHLPFD